MALGFNCSEVSDVPLEECLALEAFADSTGVDNWVLGASSWTNPSDTTACDAYGVRCGVGRVTEIHLPNNNLQGMLPPELGDLSHLAWLDLGHNQLNGPIPPELAGLPNLSQLLLWHNQLSGPIPPQLKDANLIILALGNNQLEGSIPVDLASVDWLWFLDLSNNALVGEIPTPLGQLSDLMHLDLSGNNLEGNIPRELGNLPIGCNAALIAAEQCDSYNFGLLLARNSLEGLIPTELGSLAEARLLELNNNLLTGPIPTELGNLDKLLGLDLSNNALDGPIPTRIGLLTDLRYLNLRANDLTGGIPTELGALSALESLDLFSNLLEGAIPTTLGLLENLVLLDLGSNNLIGLIPTQLGQLLNLRELYLDDNELSGQIPTTLGQLTGLDVLLLSNNELEGEVPTSLMNLVNLEELELNSNCLYTSDSALYQFMVSISGDDFDAQSRDCEGPTGYVPVLHELAVTTNDGGVVKSIPPVIDCGVNCNAELEQGTIVQLYAVADDGYYFRGWTGCPSPNTTACNLEMQTDYSITAEFQPIPAPSDGPVLHYRLENNALDDSGNDFHAQTVGNLGYIAGLDGRAGRLDGQEDSLEAPEFEWPMPAWTLSFYSLSQHLGSSPAGFRLVERYSEAPGVSKLLVDLLPSGLLSVFTSDGQGEEATLVSASSLPKGQWVHVLVTYDGNAITLYIDGQQDQVIMAEKMGIQGVTAMVIGGASGDSEPGSPGDFNGMLDDFRLYNRVLDADELEQLAGRIDNLGNTCPGNSCGFMRSWRTSLSPP